jgi:predicted acyltransferase (DUF342 family)
MSLFSKLKKSSPRGASLDLLTNKWVLYIMLILGVFDVFNFYQNGQMMSLYVFLFVGILTSFFSKNMIVIIVTAIAIAHIFTYGERMSEGFTEEEEEEKEGLEDVAEEDAVDDEAEKKKKEQPEMVPSADAIKGAAEGLAGEIKKNGVEGLSKETFDLIQAQETLLQNLGKMSDFVKVEGTGASMVGGSKKEGYATLADAYRS